MENKNEVVYVHHGEQMVVEGLLLGAALMFTGMSIGGITSSYQGWALAAAGLLGGFILGLIKGYITPPKPRREHN